MRFRSATMALLMLAAPVAFAGAAEIEIVKVTSVAGARHDKLRPKIIIFNDYRLDEKSDKGAFIQFDEWSRTKPIQRQFLSLFPASPKAWSTGSSTAREGGQGRAADVHHRGAIHAVGPAASIDLRCYATLPFIQSIDPHDQARGDQAVRRSVLKDEHSRTTRTRSELVRGHGRHGLHPLDLQARRQAADRRRARQQDPRGREEALGLHRIRERAAPPVRGRLRRGG